MVSSKRSDDRACFLLARPCAVVVESVDQVLFEVTLEGGCGGEVGHVVCAAEVIDGTLQTGGAVHLDRLGRERDACERVCQFGDGVRSVLLDQDEQGGDVARTSDRARIQGVRVRSLVVARPRDRYCRSGGSVRERRAISRERRSYWCA